MKEHGIHREFGFGNITGRDNSQRGRHRNLGLKKVNLRDFKSRPS
jgi:hypothetical protein